jgi:eukaryotic-like serine/threonine-protein kinase
MITPEKWRQVRSLFHRAVELPPDQRASLVREESNGDDEVRREVESLLAAHPQAQGFLSGGEAAGTGPSLSSGTRLGHFEIVGSLGSGGMGEVYRARDMRLDRPVAIKVLGPHLSSDVHGPERLAREARLISMLTHPHVCTLYDVGSVAVGGSDRQFLVMELLEGETLATRLRRGPLPIGQALNVAIEIVDALAAAHALGIVHRDLKPANVVLTKSGVKLLDFGLARLRGPSPSSPARLAAPAATNEPLTAEGLLVGTLPYMAPEQVRGEEADARSDLFAFGAVLYEMVTGTRAFAADSQAELIAAILGHEPPQLSTVQPLAPRALDDLVAACLEKDPGKRWQSAADLHRALTWGRDHDAALPATRQSPVRVGATRGALAWAGALAIGLVALVGIYLSRRETPSLPPTISFSVSAPEGTRFPRGTAEMAVSPDGSRLVFVALSSDGTRHLWLRQFDSVASRMLDGTEDSGEPFWSPDSRSIAFFANGRVKRIAETGGGPQIVCESGGWGGGGTWNRDGTILFSRLNGPIWRVSDTGGVPMPVTTVDASRKERGHAWPVFLPDGRRFLYLARSNDREQMSIYQASLDSNQVHRVRAAESRFNVVGPYLWLVDNSVLVAQAFDSDRAQVFGEPIHVAEQVAMDSPLRSGGALSVGASGAVAYRSASPDSHLVWFDRRGKRLETFPTPADYQHPWLSPDETRIAVEKTDVTTGRHTIWILEPSRGTTSRLISDEAGAHLPVWSPDGSQVVFASSRFGGADVYSVSADGTGAEELLLRSSEKIGLFPNDWSLDGRFLLYDARRHGQFDLWLMPASGQKSEPFFETPANERQGQFSPDTHWIAYTSDESGTQEVYVRRFPGADGKSRVSTHGGAQPRWRRDGKELFYLAPDGNLMVADVVERESSFRTAAPRALFNTGVTASFVDRRNQYVVTRDGQRFLVNISAEDENSAPITVVLNWRATLKK